jgi:hypothetical protein
VCGNGRRKGSGKCDRQRLEIEWETDISRRRERYERVVKNLLGGGR